MSTNWIGIYLIWSGRTSTFNLRTVEQMTKHFMSSLFLGWIAVLMYSVTWGYRSISHVLGTKKCPLTAFFNNGLTTWGVWWSLFTRRFRVSWDRSKVCQRRNFVFEKHFLLFLSYYLLSIHERLLLLLGQVLNIKFRKLAARLWRFEDKENSIKLLLHNFNRIIEFLILFLLV